MTSPAHDPWTVSINAQIHATLSVMHETPGVTATQRSQARSLAGEIRSLLARSAGLNLDAFRAAARGIDGARRGGQGCPGYLPQPESSQPWFEREGISLRERLDAKREERHFARRRRVANQIEQCCDCIQKIRAAAAKAVDLFLEPAQRVLQILGKFAFPNLVPAAAELVIKALRAAREVLSDHNDAVEKCLDEIANDIDDAAEEQPTKPVHYGCECACGEKESKPRPGGTGTSRPTGTTHEPAPGATTVPSAAPAAPSSPTAPASAASVGTNPAAAAPIPPTSAPPVPATTPAQAAPAAPVMPDTALAKPADRGTTALPQQSAVPVTGIPAKATAADSTGKRAAAPKTHAAGAVDRPAPPTRLCRAVEDKALDPATDTEQQQQQQQPDLAFDYEVPPGVNAELEAVTCAVAETMTPPADAGEADPVRLFGTPLGRLGAVAVLGGLGFLAYMLFEAAQTHCVCDCCTGAKHAEPAPADQQPPAPAPEAKQPEKIAPPPPELAKVPEPVPPKEKSAMMHTAAAPQSSSTGGSSITTTASASASSPSGSQPAAPKPAAPKPGAAWGSKKLGDW